MQQVDLELTLNFKDFFYKIRYLIPRIQFWDINIDINNGEFTCRTSFNHTKHG